MNISILSAVICTEHTPLYRDLEGILIVDFYVTAEFFDFVTKETEYIRFFCRGTKNVGIDLLKYNRGDQIILVGQMYDSAGMMVSSILKPGSFENKKLNELLTLIITA